MTVIDASFVLDVAVRELKLCAGRFNFCRGFAKLVHTVLEVQKTGIPLL